MKTLSLLQVIFFFQDVVVGFKDPLIHTFNKNSQVVEGSKELFGKLRDRPNVLLLGDSLGDLHMDVGVQHELDIIKIGFLNMAVSTHNIICNSEKTAT